MRRATIAVPHAVPQDSEHSPNKVKFNSVRKVGIKESNTVVRKWKLTLTLIKASRRFYQIKEDNLASVFMGYILVFLICHSPRLGLNIYELTTIESAIDCLK